jgi:hypothetical protein
MKHWKNLQLVGAARWAHCLVRFNLHAVALRAAGDVPALIQ